MASERCKPKNKTMKKILFMLVLSFALVAPSVHADIVGATVDIPQDVQFKRGFYPDEVKPNVEYINPLYAEITKDNPSVAGLNRVVIIDKVRYDFTK